MEKITIKKDLAQAIRVRAHFNRMPFDEFIGIYEDEHKTVITDKIKNDFKYTGLSNVDFILRYYK